ncbi:alanine--glyoxylate aminotransferase family protein [Anaerovibrio lipolyticus]|uniref:pyridoxal-phosphate-dependent aminotransferase family protein n=1 Tax=Anaerovibrio lipolyticus TaxID=82374 RepID=UPI0026EF206C|nr:aminotransferase class V-fold PLP-dependent enzyme [Anaerovibrio lipolyticus]MBE6105100.1 alanine--glyoxylate aminotransferase family protein [Anaerovibrio lipolyticus]
MRLFTVGPVEMFDVVKAVRAQADSVPYFRTKEFSQLMLETDELLRRFANAGEGTKTVYLTASGTAAMEAAVMNCVTEGDRLLVINGGSFGQRFVDICDIHKIPHDAVKLEYGEALDAAKLAPFQNNDYSGLLVNIDETSTGQLYDIKLLSDFCRKKNMYLVVDAISSFLCDEFDMAGNEIDVVIASSQKGACISPGLSMVLLSKRIIDDRVMKSNIRSLYFDFKDYFKNFERGQTPYTPAVGICIELSASLKMIERTGLERHLKNIADVAADFREKIKALPVSLPEFPLSNAITPIIFKEPIAYKVFEFLKDKYGIFVNPTGGKMADYSLRIAHIGQTSKEDNTMLVEKIKAVIDEMTV